jgi:hypothetical protein
MNRREIIAGLGTAAAWPVVARAQQPGKLLTIGFLGGRSTEGRPATIPILRRLGELGWVEGRTMARCACRIRRYDEQMHTPDPHTGLLRRRWRWPPLGRF